jgi:hypothetical protein
MKKTIVSKIRGLAAGFEVLKKRFKEERGVAVPLVAIVMTVLVAMAGVGVDTGRVASVATEAQNAADIAALAAVRAVADEDDPTSMANETLSQNSVNGGDASTYLTSLQLGNVDADYNFTVGGTPTNAVRAVVAATVDTIVLGSIGFPQATVTREAIATLAGMGSGVPTLPVVLGDCHFDPTCESQACMPYLSQVPDTTNNSAWTSFFLNNTNNNTVGAYINSPCGDGDTQFIKVGDDINLNNGQSTPLLRDIQCLLNNGMNTFVIPIVPCVGGTYNQDKPVVGFAKIEIDHVISTGSPKGIWLHGIYDGSPGAPGGGNFGLNVVSLIK